MLYSLDYYTSILAIVSPRAVTQTMMMMAARRATKLTMMATTMTMATGDDDDDVDGTAGDGAMGYDNNDDGDGQRRQ